jgi:hypothetical protein
MIGFRAERSTHELVSVAAREAGGAKKAELLRFCVERYIRTAAKDYLNAKAKEYTEAARRVPVVQESDIPDVRPNRESSHP